MNPVIAYNLAAKANKGVTALADKVVIKGNTAPYVPTEDYEPATKKYIDDIAKNGISTSLGRTMVYEAISAAGTAEFFETGPTKQKDRVSITAVVNSFDYVVEVNANTYKYTSDADATIGEIRDGLEVLIDADSSVGCTHDGDDLIIEAVTENVRVRIMVSDNMGSLNEVAASDGTKYIPGAVTVFVNGSMVASSEYTATDKNKIVFGTGLNDQDKVVMIAYGGEGVVGSSAGTTSTVELVDEDDMASDSDAKAPTQQSVKAYVDAHSSGLAMIDGGSASVTAAEQIVEVNGGDSNGN